MASVSVGVVGRVFRRFWWIPAIFVFLFALYTGLGFWLVPRLARNYATGYIEKDLGRHVRIGEITFNPFSFIAEIKSFALTEADNTPLASFDFLHADFELSSLFSDAWTFKEIRVDKPDLKLLVAADGSVNLAKLAPPPKPGEALKPAGPAAMPALRIGTLGVHDGRVGIEDRTRGAPFATTLTPLEFTLNDFRTAPNFQNVYKFEAATTAGEKLSWAGRFSVQPLGSTGTFAVGSLKAATIASYLQEALPFQLVSGSLDLEGQYRVTIADAMGLSVELPALKVHDVAIAPRGPSNAAPWVTVPETVISNIKLSLPEQNVAVDRVDVENAKLTVWREPNGEINLTKLLPPPSAASAPAAKPFAIQVGTVAVKNASVAGEDRMMRPATKMALGTINATVTGVTSDMAGPLKLDASLTVNGKAKLAAKGDVSLTPLATTMAVDLADFDLLPLRPYLASLSAVQLVSGQVSAKTKIAMNPKPARGQAGMQVTGEVTVANLVTRDPLLRQDLVKWQRLQLTGIDFRQGPDSLSIDRVAVRRPYGKVVISPDRTINIVSAIAPPANVRPAGRTVAEPTPPAVIAAARARTNEALVNVAATGRPNPQTRGLRALNPVPAKPAGPMPVRIKTVAIEDGAMDFADFSILPNFTAAISALNGTVMGLSSDPNSRAQVKLAGSVDRYAPVDISGQVNLLAATAYSDIAMNFRNMELTTFNPYSGKYAGYNITKGKLTTELHYKVENRKLDATHHVVLDQLEFGDATNSKDAVPLPIRLAVALLKDRNGVIDLNLPVSGSLDDPQFQIGPVVWQLFVGLITKIVEAPFAIIGSLFGGGDELAYVEFAPGQAAITPAEAEKLSKIARGLAERPELKLDIPLRTLTPADDAVLAEAAYSNAISGLNPNANADPSDIWLVKLSGLYFQRLGMKPVYPAPPMPQPKDFDPVPGNIAFLEEAIKKSFTASEPMRDTLARARANAVRDAVLAQEGVQPERVFLSERESGKGGAKSVRMELNLQ